MQILQPIDITVIKMLDRRAGRDSRAERRVIRHAPSHGLGAYRVRFADRLLAFRGIDDKRDLAVLNAVNNMRTPFQHLVHRFNLQSRIGQDIGRTLGGNQVKSQVMVFISGSIFFEKIKIFKILKASLNSAY